MPMSDIENIDLSQVCEVVVTEGRRSCAERSILKFARLYLGHYFNDRSSRMHVKIATLLRRASQDRGARLAVAAAAWPRQDNSRHHGVRPSGASATVTRSSSC
jgi:hypothetical protein